MSLSNTADTASRRKTLQALLDEERLDCVMLSSRENTRYFTGFSGTESLTALSVNGSTLLVDSRYSEQAASQCAGQEIVEIQGSKLRGFAKIALERKWRRIGVEDHDLTVSAYRELQELLPDIQLVSSSSRINKQRWSKDETEIEKIKKAVDLADRAFDELLSQIKIGMTENEVAARLEFLMRLHGASGPSFETIVASGARSALPHGVATDKELVRGNTVVLDFGCVYQGYCSDITRTIFLGEPDRRMLEIYEIVLNAQLTAESAIRAGMTGQACDASARRVIDEAGYAQYFGHSLGHSLGLLIHENPNFSPSCLDPIPAGAVLSVEPGIYLPGLGGVRIEDVGVVRTDRFDVLTQSTKRVIVLNS